MPNICNLRLSMQSGKPHPEASVWLHNYNALAGRSAGMASGVEADEWVSTGSVTLCLFFSAKCFSLDSGRHKTSSCPTDETLPLCVHAAT